MTALTIESTLKTAAGCSVRIMTKIASYLALGVVINIPLLILLTPDFVALFNSEGIPDYGLSGGNRDLFGAALTILVWVGANLIPVALFFLFSIGFLIGYFIIGKKEGVASALNYAFNTNKSYLIGNLLVKFVDYLQTKVDINQLEGLSTITDKFESYKKKMKNQPLVIRWLSKALLKKLDFLPIVTKMFEGATPENLKREDYIFQFAESVSNKLNIELWKTSIMPLVILVVVNISVGILLKVLL